MTEQEKIDLIISSKEQYRRDARALSWEEKVASIERMRDASAKAKQGMQATLKQERNQ